MADEDFHPDGNDCCFLLEPFATIAVTTVDRKMNTMKSRGRNIIIIMTEVGIDALLFLFLVLLQVNGMYHLSRNNYLIV